MVDNTQTNEDQRDLTGNFWQRLFERRKKFAYLNEESIWLGIMLAIVGGFLDAYTYISRNGVFATAQTGNLVLLGLKMAQGKWYEGFLHFPPILAFVTGVTIAEIFKHPPVRKIFPNPARTVLFLEIIAVTIVGAFPLELPNIIVTVTISFVASLQISTFRKLIKWQFNSTMITGNLLTATEAAYLAISKHDRQAVRQTFHFISVLISFWLGAIVGTLATFHLGIKAIWVSSLILFVALLVLNPNPKPLVKSSS